MTDPTQLSDEELSARVAEEVMGWKSVPSPSGDYVAWETPEGKRRNTWCAAESFRGLLCWSPATSIADAWEVVEKFDYYESYQNEALDCSNAHYWYLEAHEGNNYGNAKASTASRAICIAALRAKEED